MALENTYLGKGIVLAGGFDLQAKAPLDSRTTVETYAGLAALVDGNAAYEGMKVYVETGDSRGNYQYIDGAWVNEADEIKALIGEVSTNAMEFKGATTTLPESGAKGDMWKVIASLTVSADLDAQGVGFEAKLGDTIVNDGNGKWYLIPSGDDIEDTWRPVIVGGSTLEQAETLEFIAGTNVTLAEENGKVTISATDTDTHHEAKAVIANEATDATDETAVAGNVHLNIVENGEVRSSHKIVGAGGVSVSYTAGEDEEPGTLTIEAPEGAKYDLEANKSAANGNVVISLKGSDETQDNVALEGAGATTVTTDANGKVIVNTDISGKADKVSGATEGNFAGLDANGNLVDSGKKANDFEVAGTAQQLIEALDVTDITGFGAGKTLATLTEEDGKIAATFQDIAITESQITDLGDYKTKQTAVGNKITSAAHVISNLAQNGNGEVTYEVKELTPEDIGAATAAQGALADSALQEIKTAENGGLKVTNKNQIDIDTDVVFVLNCNYTE